MGDISELFSRFFLRLHGYTPYKWQLRLVQMISNSGIWPDAIDGPTGSGKSEAIVDAHVFLNAYAGKDRVSISVPRRLVIAVNRRALVDSQFLHAKQVAKLLAEAGEDDPVLFEVAQGLAARWGGNWPPIPSCESPLIVSMMRGGLVGRSLETSWRIYPEAPEIICATPDMVGSRLLFRGYGTSAGMRPVEAGLLGRDTVLVVDEAHLNHQLIVTAQSLASLEGQMDSSPLNEHGPKPLQVVAASATLPAEEPERDASRVGVTNEDFEADPELAQRVGSPKQISLERLEAKKDYPARLCQMAQEAKASHGGVVAVIVNSVFLAAAVAAELRKNAGDKGVVCVLGKMRREERRQATARLTAPIDDAADFIVGTQALEVGLNYDCQTMLTELAPAASLVQRLGRLNRYGRYVQASAVIVDNPSSVNPYQPEDLERAREWVRSLPNSVSALWLSQNKVPMMPKRPVFQRLELWDAEYLSHTSEILGAETGVQTPGGDCADLNLWLRDELDAQDDVEVSVVVRADLPKDDIAASGLLDRVPPLAGEVFPCSIGTMREVCKLRNAGKDGAFRVFASVDTGSFHPLGQDESAIPGGVYVVDDSAPVFLGGVVYPNQTIKTAATRTETDIYNEVASDTPGAPIIVSAKTADVLATRTDLDADTVVQVVTLLRDTAEAWAADDDDDRSLDDVVWEAVVFVGKSNPTAFEFARRIELVPVRDKDGDIDCFACVYRPSIEAEGISAQEVGGEISVGLDRHEADVATLAGKLASAVGLDDELGKALSEAGSRHDDGKADTRFQKMLGGGRLPATPLAKGVVCSRGNISKLYETLGLRGWRHEQLSAAIAWDALGGRHGGEQAALITRLIGTSHGRGRSIFGRGADGLAVGKAVDGHERAADELFLTGAWEAVVARTDSKHGYWGMAYLEALLRAADARASTAERQEGGCDEN